MELSQKEHNIISREKFLDVKTSLAEEGIDNRREALKHMQLDRSNLEKKSQILLDGLVEKSENLQASLSKKELEVGEMLRELRKRELELEDRQKKSQLISEEN